MSSSLAKWCHDRLSKLLEFEAPDDLVKYLLGMNNAQDMREYLEDFLDVSQPEHKKFVQELLKKWRKSVPENVTVYRKGRDEEEAEAVARKNGSKSSKGSGGGKPAAASNSAAGTTSGARKVDLAKLHAPRMPGDPPRQLVLQDNTVVATAPAAKPTPPPTTTTTTRSTPPDNSRDAAPADKSGSGNRSGSSGATSGGKKKTRFVSLYSSEGQSREVAVLPGRHPCECQAQRHGLVDNCLRCGRVICLQEGPGPCLFCGALVATKEQQGLLADPSRQGHRLRQRLAERGGATGQAGSEVDEATAKAREHRDRLLEYDKSSVRRTQVIDDEVDYFAADSNQWLSQTERGQLKEREAQLREQRHTPRSTRHITLDFAGRQVLEDHQTVNVYDREDAVVQAITFGAPTSDPAQPVPEPRDLADLVNPGISQPAPQFLPEPSRQAATNKGPAGDQGQGSAAGGRGSAGPRHRVQDRGLLEMSDQGVCLSMHQPWASLLVAGIKQHEGRTWYTAHRGKLWIAATAKPVATEEVEQMEAFYRGLEAPDGPGPAFPAAYPSGCLLGCVEVAEVLPQEEYRRAFPRGEWASPYVLVCRHPQQLVVKLPVKGQHKLWSLDTHLHQAAKRGLRPAQA